MKKSGVVIGRRYVRGKLAKVGKPGAEVVQVVGLNGTKAVTADGSEVTCASLVMEHTAYKQRVRESLA